jgi:hypothetical protein
LISIEFKPRPLRMALWVKARPYVQANLKKNFFEGQRPLVRLLLLGPPFFQLGILLLSTTPSAGMTGISLRKLNKLTSGSILAWPLPQCYLYPIPLQCQVGHDYCNGLKSDIFLLQFNLYFQVMQPFVRPMSRPNTTKHLRQ